MSPGGKKPDLLGRRIHEPVLHSGAKKNGSDNTAFFGIRSQPAQRAITGSFQAGRRCMVD